MVAFGLFTFFVENFCGTNGSLHLYGCNQRESCTGPSESAASLLKKVFLFINGG